MGKLRTIHRKGEQPLSPEDENVINAIIDECVKHKGDVTAMDKQCGTCEHSFENGEQGLTCKDPKNGNLYHLFTNDSCDIWQPKAEQGSCKTCENGALLNTRYSSYYDCSKDPRLCENFEHWQPKAGQDEQKESED